VLAGEHAALQEAAEPPAPCDGERGASRGLSRPAGPLRCDSSGMGPVLAPGAGAECAGARTLRGAL
jgi:hypothetical protein